MIERPTSLQLMDEFEKAKTDIGRITTDIEEIKLKMSKKLEILDAAYSYGAELAENIRIKNDTELNSTVVFANDLDSIVDGHYDIYGETVHAQYVQLPTHVFNILTESGPIFKDNAHVEFYETNDSSVDHEDTLDYQYSYGDMLKYETDITKDDVFKIFNTNLITMVVTVNVGNIPGGTNFDTIEISPYLPGSFDINQIRVYLMETQLNPEENTNIADKFVYTPIKNVGNMRIDLGETSKLYRIEFDLRLNYKHNGYPFGLRHLYFLDTSADKSSDCVVVKIDQDRYIESVGEEIELITPFGTVETTTDNYGVKLYMFYENDTLQAELSNPITRSIKSFYAKIPLYEPLIGIRFKNIVLR